MPIDEYVEAVINEARERLQSRYPECKKCPHKGETHGMNCLECCPVEYEPFCSCGKPGKARTDNGLWCGVHCDQCFDEMISDCRWRSW